MLHKFLKSVIFIFFLVYYLLNSNISSTVGLEVLELWVFKVILSIVPMYVFSVILINNPFISKIIYKFKLVKRFFENEKAFLIFVISFFTGNPTSSILIKNSLEKKEISFNQATTLLNCCSYLSPLFLIVMLGHKLGLVILVSSFVSSLILYLLSYKKIIFEKNIINHINLTDTINDVINDVPFIMFKILTSMWIIALFKAPFDFIKNPYLAFIIDLGEISTGIVNILNYPINFYLIIVFISIITSFNGCAILLQVYNVIKKTRLSFKHYIKMRLFHAILNVCFSLVGYYLIEFLM